MENIIDIVLKKVSGELILSTEQLLLDEWLLIPENKQMFHEYHKVWLLTGNLNFNLKPDVDAEWQLFKNKINITKKSRKLSSSWIAVAASILVIFGIWSVLKVSNQPDKVYQTQNSIQQIELPDHSLIILNKNSLLEVDNKFNETNRTIALNGEAYFEIAKDAEHPFEVSTSTETKIKVLGTSFNLKVTKTENLLDVFSGKVSFLPNNSEQWVTVKKGEQLTYNTLDNKIIPIKEFNCNANSWNTGNFAFDNTPIEEVAQQLSEYIGKKVILPKNSDHLRYSGTFLNPSDQQIAEVLALAMGWEYKITKQSVVFIIKEKAIQ